ncbi:hypothetical protein SPRG_02896 [Saprolegnia parasitica CBS 223.65]|uniref:DUF4460 domain-containing protein n=1 Tax=Saprolegnia parasitica (strain CBS 223.65) TaxID=695850 RepID=A0A067CNY0_SAPPC|nr:hypothetical protein SPRG_02896 [Saprolegnia parasitica CBS 223.65]KDO32419.1 hypothetical protein SPRG_02896 [Saprolegnia parasitica CBS 223.65]|eukprot:XP_012196873.1 hypothetical protein SPRG_02896 [Saprolegnia parasitica CBS 223.65]
MIGTLLARRGFASSAKLSMKPINLKLVASSFLLQVHPDVLQFDRRGLKDVHESIKDRNEDALKHLNAFLDMAGAGCNGNMTNDLLNTRSFAFDFHVPVPKKLVKRHTKPLVDVDGQAYLRIREKVILPPELYDMTLQSISPLGTNIIDKTAMLWRKYTNSVLSSLFHQADIPVVSQHANGQLLPWDEDLTETSAVGDGSAREAEDIEKKFRKMLTRERNIVFKHTTGFEADVQRHRVLLDLLKRVHVGDIATADQERAFNWLGEVLLRNFMELRLHNLIWNRVVLILTEDPNLHKHVIDDVSGVAIVLGFTDDLDDVVRFLHDQVEQLEAKFKSTDIVVSEATKPSKSKRRPSKRS